MEGGSNAAEIAVELGVEEEEKEVEVDPEGREEEETESVNTVRGLRSGMGLSSEPKIPDTGDRSGCGCRVTVNDSGWWSLNTMSGNISTDGRPSSFFDLCFLAVCFLCVWCVCVCLCLCVWACACVWV